MTTSLAFLLPGCITGPQHPAATQPATLNQPLATTQPTYWLDQPGPVVEHGDFDTLWSAAELAGRHYRFVPDRTDRRLGLLTTQPLVSGQWFEPWRNEQQGPTDVLNSSLKTTRRTLRFEFKKLDTGYEVTPKVLVEEQTIAERRITTVVAYRSLFRSAGRGIRFGSAETDQGIDLARTYWRPLNRDTQLELAVAEQLRKELSRVARR